MKYVKKCWDVSLLSTEIGFYEQRRRPGINSRQSSKQIGLRTNKMLPVATGISEGQIGFALQRQRFLRHIFEDTIGFAACKMMRRIYGLAKVADIAEIPDLKARLGVERNVMRMAKVMVQQRGSFRSIEELTALAQEISPLR